MRAGWTTLRQFSGDSPNSSTSGDAECTESRSFGDFGQAQFNPVISPSGKQNFSRQNFQLYNSLSYSFRSSSCLPCVTNAAKKSINNPIHANKIVLVFDKLIKLIRFGWSEFYGNRLISRSSLNSGNVTLSVRYMYVYVYNRRYRDTLGKIIFFFVYTNRNTKEEKNTYAWTYFIRN